MHQFWPAHAGLFIGQRAGIAVPSNFLPTKILDEADKGCGNPE